MSLLNRGSVEHAAGDLVLAVTETALLVIDDGDGRRDQSTTASVMSAAATGDPATVRDAITVAASVLPSMAALLKDGDTWRVFAVGEFIITSQSEAATLTLDPSGATQRTVADTTLPAATRSVTISPFGAALSRGQGAPLSQPTTRSGSVFVNLTEPVATATSVANQTPSESPQTRDGVVQVFGIRCPRDHHNHPAAVICAQCGLRMGLNKTAAVGLGPRPALGLLLLDDGTTITIDRDLVVGREPQFGELVEKGKARAVAVTDTELSLSRSHFSIRLSEWQVTIVDLGSSNGTFVWSPVSSTWQMLEAHQPRELRAGERVRAGAREFQVELHHTPD